MIAEYAVTGEIFHIIFEPITPETLDAFEANGRPFVHQLVDNERAWTVDNCYVANGEILRRPEFAIDAAYNIVADDVDAVVITNLPTPCTVRWNKTDYVVTDGVFEFAAATPGVYQLKFTAFPFVPKRITVNALAPVPE